ELIYAIQNKMPYAEVKNSAGQFMKATIDSVTAALATAEIPDDFRFSMTNAPGKDAYPICGATWLLVYEQQKDPAKGKKLVEFLNGLELWHGSVLAIKKFGFHFLVTSTWDPVADQFGALPFIYGTLVSSLIALLIAVPLGIATAAYLTELAPLWIRQPLVSLIEMLAAIPSVILGLWGIFVMIPWLRDYPFPFLKRFFGWTPFFTVPIS